MENSLLPDVVETMLPTFSGKLALRMVFRINADYYGEGDDFDAPQLTDYVEMLIYRPTNYTKIFVRIKSSSQQDYPELWTKVTDHDSCWRSDGFSAITKHQYDLVSRLAKERQIPFKEISSVIHFDLFDGKPSYVTVEECLAKDKSQDNPFPRIYSIKVGTEVPLKEIHKFLR